MTFKFITLEIKERVAILAMNQPQTRNALSAAMQSEMLEALSTLRRQEGIRAMVLTGSGRGFCAGADLGNMQEEGRSLGETTAETMERFSNPIMLALRGMPFPVVAAINGAAAGAGVGLALAADITIAAQSAFFLLPFVPRLGLIPDLGICWFLARRIGLARANGLMLLGDRLDAETAVRWGMIWDCCPDAALPEMAMAVARRLAAVPSHSIHEARRVLELAETHTLAQQLEYERRRQHDLLDRPAFQEGLNAFLEKRNPDFC